MSVRCPEGHTSEATDYCDVCGAVIEAASPAAGTAAPSIGWVAELWVDPDWYAHEAVSSTDPCPNTGTPRVVPLRSATELIGRTSASRNLHPTIDCGSDSAVSRRHAEVTIDGDTAYVEDLRSVNGTYVGKSGKALPDQPIAPGRRRALTEDDRVYVGAWTRIVIRPATAEESST